MSEQTAILSLVKMNKRWKILLAAIALAPFVILFIGLLYTRISHFSRSWPEEIKSRGWRVLYSEETSDRFVAICDAGDNKIAVIDTDWDNHLAGGSRLGIYDSENNDIAPGRGEPLNTGVSR